MRKTEHVKIDPKELKKWINDNNLTYAEIGNIIGRSANTVANFVQRGEIIPVAYNLLIDVFNLPKDAFQPKTTKDHKAPSAEDIVNDLRSIICDEHTKTICDKAADKIENLMRYAAAVSKLPNDTGKTFYYTFGNSDTSPYIGGWVEIVAPEIRMADYIFNMMFPPRGGVMRCAGIYTQENFAKTSMPKNGNFGKFCHKRVTLHVE